MKLQGKVALVTGSSQGIGQGIAVRLADEGANIVIDYRSHPEGVSETLASAIPAQVGTGIWIYFTAPLLGMLAAAEVYVRLMGKNAVKCAKLHHHNNKRCIFRCGYRKQAMGDASQLLSDRLPTL